MALVHEYRFAEDDWLADSVGSADLTAVGGASRKTGFAFGRRNVADLLTAAEYLDASDNVATYQTYSEGYISAWIKTAETGLHTIFAMTVAGGSSRQFHLFTLGGKLYCRSRGSSSTTEWYIVSDGTPITTTDWHHIIISVGPVGKHQMFVDGEAEAFSYSIPASDGDTRLGWWDGGNPSDEAWFGNYRTDPSQLYHWPGYLGWIEIGDAEITAEEAAAIYDKSLPRYVQIVLAGQSNMRGSYGPKEDGVGEPEEPDPRILQVNQSGTLLLAEETLEHTGAGSTNVGLGLALGKAAIDAILPVAEDNGEWLMVLITGANGSTGFGDDDWNDGDTVYENAITLSNNVTALNSDYNYVAFIAWHQGENDTTSEAFANAYAGALDAMIVAMRTDLTGATDTTPFIAGQLGTFYDNANSDTVKDALASLPGRVAHTGFASSGGLTDGGDNVHFDVASSREMGRRLWQAYTSLGSTAFSGFYTFDPAFEPGFLPTEARP